MIKLLTGIFIFITFSAFTCCPLHVFYRVEDAGNTIMENEIQDTAKMISIILDAEHSHYPNAKNQLQVFARLINKSQGNIYINSSDILDIHSDQIVLTKNQGDVTHHTSANTTVLMPTDTLVYQFSYYNDYIGRFNKFKRALHNNELRFSFKNMATTKGPLVFDQYALKPVLH